MGMHIHQVPVVQPRPAAGTMTTGQGLFARSEPVTDTALENELRQDIEALHEFFVGWYNGNLPENAYDTEFEIDDERRFQLTATLGLGLTGVALFAALIAAGWAIIGAWLGRSYQSIVRDSQSH